MRGEGGAKEAHLAEFVHDFAVEVLVAEAHEDAREELLLAELVGGVADGALVFSELAVELQGVIPFERPELAFGGGRRGVVHGGAFRLGMGGM